MKRPVIFIIIIAAVIAALGVVLVSGGDKSADKPMSSSGEMDMSKSGNSSKETPKQDEVFIQDFAFGPAKLTIKKGTTITWTNKDSARHDIKPDKEDPNFTASKLLSKGESYSFTFNTAGTYNYHCTPHPYMKAVVEVTE